MSERTLPNLLPSVSAIPAPDLKEPARMLGDEELDTFASDASSRQA